jgi:hypothetical protein
MREIDEVLRRRPGLETLADQAQALRDQLAAERGASVPGASALTAAELPAADAVHAPVVPGIRLGDVLVPSHRQVGGVLDLPQAGRFLPQPGGHQARDLGLLER